MTASKPSRVSTRSGAHVSTACPASRRSPATTSPMSPVAPCFDAAVTRMFMSVLPRKFSSSVRRTFGGQTVPEVPPTQRQTAGQRTAVPGARRDRAARLPVQVIPEIRVCNGDEVGDTFADAAPEQLSDAVLRHDRPNVGSARHHSGARREHARRSARPCRRRPRRKRDDGPALSASAAPRMKSIWPPTPE